MDNLRAIRHINMNRAEYFHAKNRSKRDHNPTLISTFNGPLLNRASILEAIHYITGNNKYQSFDIPPLPYNKQNLNLVIVTCIHRTWHRILSIMATYPVKKIVAVWSDPDDEAAVIKFSRDPVMGPKLHFIRYDRNPLNHQWQRGLLEAAQFQPEAVVLQEQDHLITYDYLKDGMEKIHEEGMELVGTRNWLDVFLQDPGANEPDYIKLCQYNEYKLKGEFILSGRMISVTFLQKMKWQLFHNPNPINTGLDKITSVNILRLLPKIYEMIPDTITNLGVISIKDHESEKYMPTYDSQFPGNTWIMELINKSRFIDYTVSKDIYAARK